MNLNSAKIHEKKFVKTFFFKYLGNPTLFILSFLIPLNKAIKQKTATS